jgi:hypothetical protein
LHSHLKRQLSRNPAVIMRRFRLYSKSHNAQYTSTKIKAIPVRTDTAMQEMLANSFLISARKELCLKDLLWYAYIRGVVGTLVSDSRFALNTLLSSVTTLYCQAHHSSPLSGCTDMFYFPLFGKNFILADHSRLKVKMHFQKFAFQF